MKSQRDVKLTTTMKLLYAHLNLFKLLFYCLILAFFLMAFTITYAFYSHKITFNNIILATPHKLYALTNSVPSLSVPSPPQPPSLPRLALESISGSRRVVGLDEHLSDEELMYKATKVGTREKMVPKVAFLFLIKGSIPLAPLWEEFFKGHQGFYSIYVHSDPSFTASSELDSGVFRGRRIPSKVVEWGKFSMVEAELRLLSNALLDPSNQRFVLLSEACIPLFNFNTVYSYLTNSAQSYIEAYDKVGHTGRGRYKPYMAPTVTVRQWRKGSQWFEMDRALATEVISDQGYFQLFKSACKAACYADEHYLSTWVNINFGPKNTNRSITWVDWSNGGSHPARYRRMHVTPEFLEQLRSNETCTYNGKNTSICYLFARKFMPDSLDRLLRFAPKAFKF